MRGTYLLKAITDALWAITPEGFMVLSEVVRLHAAGERLTPDEIRARIGAARLEAELHAVETEAALQNQAAAGGGSGQGGTIAVMPLFGSIVPRASLMTEVSGLASAEGFGKKFQAALADSNVSGIVIDINSPGGAVPGMEELSTDIYKARGQKPVVAIANHLAASAAYWIGTAADELWVTPSGEVGSIGVFAVHEDWSKRNEMDGVKMTYLKAGKYKAEGNPDEPLSEEAKTYYESRVAEAYDMFVKAVARNRGVPVDQVRNGFGEGRVVGAKEAVKLGMADRIGTLSEAITAVAKRARSAQPVASRSEAEELELRQRRARALTL